MANGRISKRVFPEIKARQIFRKTNISDPLIRTRTCAYQGVINIHFSESLASFVFLKHPFWDSPICLITVEKYYNSLETKHVFEERERVCFEWIRKNTQELSDEKLRVTAKKHQFRSCPEVFGKKGILRNFAKFTGKHLCQSLFW